MNITSRSVNDSHIDEIAAMVQKGKFIMNLDRGDVAQVLQGREGTLFLARQDAGTSNATFLRDFFSYLKKQDPIRRSTHVLLSIGCAPDDPLMMDDMSIIGDFFDELCTKDVEAKWGLKTNAADEPMTLLMLCAK